MIRAFVVETATAAVRQRVTAPDEGSLAGMVLDEDCTLLRYFGDADIETIEPYLDGTLKLRPRTADPAMALAITRTVKRQAVTSARDNHEWAGCAAPLGRMDTDPDSQRKINGSVTMALIAQSLGQPFSIDWTMEDNSTIAHDAPAMIAAGVAVGQYVADCHARALVLKDLIDAAADMAALNAIDIEAGWPA